MAYENKIAIESCVKKVHEQQGTIEKTQLIINEIEEVYRKAKTMDEIEQAYWKSNTPENFAYDFVGIFEKHFSNGVERADDEK
ncbi:hypothetical protein [Staphylococcus cohnii]|uniref:hypothetical protein n=1 Tax=Staphylococcus cohnii TaxID=29382 RepID=UPI003D7EB467